MKLSATYLGSALMALVLMTLVLCGAPAMAASDPEAAKDVLKRSVAFESSLGKGQVPALAAYYASVLKRAGYADGDIEIMPMGETATLAATLKGSNPKLKPILLSGHMDVVAANKADWTRDPFVPVEENGYIFGRGAEDNKYDVAMMISTMARLKKEGYRPKRSIILLLSGDEETSMTTTRALAQKYKDAELLLNGDGGGGTLGEDGKPVLYKIQAGEKTYADFEVSFTDPGGHSSAPTATNPVYRMAKAIGQLEAFKFPPMSNELTRATLKVAAGRAGGSDIGAVLARYAADPTDVAAADQLSTHPEFIGQVRTTCIPTMVNGGHAENALPQRAAFNINCRIFPGVPVETVKAELVRVIADSSATVTTKDDPTSSDASPLRKDVTAAVTKAVRARYPGLEVVPGMDAGATDSLYFRALGVPCYGVASLFTKPSDSFAHGLNERVPVAGIGASLDQWYSVVTDLSK
ncbi:MAG: M20/M25/M40 family metallo-hydrolase [Sphingobium phenoxybenzoativorans]